MLWGVKDYAPNYIGGYMKLTNNEKFLLSNWINLTTHIGSADIPTCKRILAYEEVNAQRTTFIKRIKQRIVGATEEQLRKDLGGDDSEAHY